MTSLDIARQRLRNQHITSPTFEKPRDVVGWLGAVQAQDYAGAKWAVAQRAQGITDAALDQALAEGAILRTHVMRPTWHFVSPADIRWMLKLTAPRVHAANAYMYRQLELDDAEFKRSNAALTKALQGGKQLTRAEIASVFQQARIAATGLRFGYLMMRAELDGVVCSGARRGKQFTYALLEERAPKAKAFERDEALAKLSRRYFTSRGPATLKDFVWWSGLTTADAKAGIEVVSSQLNHEIVDGQTYWFPDPMPTAPDKSPTAYLLSTYDEYVIGYKDRSASIDAVNAKKIESGDSFSTIVLNGQIIGTWKRTLKKSTVVVETKCFTPLTKDENQAVAVAAHQYGAFLELPVALA